MAGAELEDLNLDQQELNEILQSQATEDPIYLAFVHRVSIAKDQVIR